ncbi:MAG TPA: MFS transporter [Candidatus Avidesulfovibrio excrementigallinarum]|nr:MFS transporter [Candidatus Avidesulfovibrio excrementigallinarum]
MFKRRRTLSEQHRQPLFSRNFNLICLCNLCTCMAGYSLLPVLPLYLLDVLHCPNTIMGLALAVFPLVALISRPVSGLLADRPNRRVILIAATASCALLFPTTLCATVIPLFMLVRFIHGASFAVMTTTQATLAVSFIPEGRLGSGIGLFSSTLSLGMIFGPMLGLSAASAFSYDAAFWLSCGFATTGALLQLCIKPPKHEAAPRPSSLALDNFFMLKGTYTLLALFMAAFMQGLITNYVSVLAREHGLEDYASLYFLLMGTGLLISRLFAGPITDRGYLVTQVCVAELTTLGCALWLATTTSPAAFLVCGGIMGMALGVLPPSYQTILVRLADKGRRGVANSMYFIGMDGGICFSLLAGGVVSEFLDMGVAYMLGGAVQLLGLGIFFRFVVPQYRAVTGKL